MNNKFDELTKSMAQSVTRRAALKKFGVGLAGMALACFGLANKAKATTVTGYCEAAVFGGFHGPTHTSFTGYCIGLDPRNGACVSSYSADCPEGKNAGPVGGTGCLHQPLSKK